jgi:hypothetical protein
MAFPRDAWREVDVEGNTTATAVGSILVPAKCVVDKVFARVEVPYDAASSASLEVGDGGDPDGFLISADVQGASAGDVFGADLGDLGEYLSVDTGASSGYCVGPGKYYAAADTVDAVVTINAAGGANTKGRVKVIIHYCQLD